VVGEIAVGPLSLGLPIYALLFSIANAIVLTIRIKAENAALSGLPQQDQPEPSASTKRAVAVSRLASFEPRAEVG
jgi:hypothetical protein